MRDEVAQAANLPGRSICANVLASAHCDNLIARLEALGTELEQVVECCTAFLERPVTTPIGMELETELVDAVRNLSEGKRPFGWTGIVGKAEQKEKLKNIRVGSSLPPDVEELETCI